MRNIRYEELEKRIESLETENKILKRDIEVIDNLYEHQITMLARSIDIIAKKVIDA